MTTLADIAGLTTAHHRAEVARRIDPLLPADPVARLGRQALATKAATSLATQLDDPLDHLVTDACERDAGLQHRANVRTRVPGQPIKVTLGRQTISRVERPRLELQVGNKQQLLLELTLSVELAFTTLVLDVLDGRVVRIHPSDAEASVTLAAAGTEIVRREKVPLSFPDNRDHHVVRSMGQPTQAVARRRRTPARPDTNDVRRARGRR